MRQFFPASALSSAELAPASRLSSLRSGLLAWSALHRRDFPWRQTRNPWAVLVSEIMLQQTQTARVIPRYSAFLAAFPNPRACAAASVGDVLREWAGLGYNRRAANLHAAAVVLRDDYDGSVPMRLEDLLTLPGVGPYTARAVLVFAFEQHHGVVDVNAGRVFARAVAGRSLRNKEAQELADQMVPVGAAWEWNQAILDLGATICVKHNPACGECPVRKACAWRVCSSQNMPQATETEAADAADATDDPAAASAAAGKLQSRFAGSDRQIRGRIVDRLRQGPVPLPLLAESLAENLAENLTGSKGVAADPLRVRRLLDGLFRDGLVVCENDIVRLP